MKKIIFLLVALFLIAGCKKDISDTAICGKTDPLTELNWLKELIAKNTDRSITVGFLVSFKIIAYQYKGQALIEHESIYHSSPYLHVFDCNGKQLFLAGDSLGKNEYKSFLESRKLIKVLFEFVP